MKLTERLNVLIQAASLSQKNGLLTLDEAVKAKTAIDTISSGTLNQQFAAAINMLIEIAISSQKKGAYSLKDAYMLYIAIEGIESELQNEVNRLNMKLVRNEPQTQTQQVVQQTTQPNQTKKIEQNTQNDIETIITIPPQELKRN